jgi:integrase
MKKNHGNDRLMFEAVYDSRKEKIRGLWRRGGRYYAQLRVAGAGGKEYPTKVALSAGDLDEARAELERVRVDNRRGANVLPRAGRPADAPAFAAFAAEYLASPAHASKDKSTRSSERYSLEYWKAQIGAVPLNKITAPMLQAYKEKRLAGRIKEGARPVKARTVNIELCAFHAVMKLARARGLVAEFPSAERLQQRPSPKRPLLRPEDIARLIAACRPETTKNAALLSYYLRFLALTGAREKEGLRTPWAGVDFGQKLVTIPDGKNGEDRAVNFNPELGVLLGELWAARQPDSSYLFPSAQRGGKDISAKTIRESFAKVRTAAGMPWVCFHDFRHFFASQCVMAGIDFKTIAAWLGHRDGGILVGKVYGHLSDDHKRRMGAGLAILEAPANVVPARFGAAV